MYLLGRVVKLGIHVGMTLSQEASTEDGTRAGVVKNGAERVGFHIALCS